MWTVLLLLGALAEGRLWSQTKPKKQPPPESIVSPLDDAVARTASVAAWFRGGPPPRHWVATLPNDYRGGASLGQDTVTASVDAWFRGGPPPRHWTATLPNNYRGGALLGQGTVKKAFAVPNRTDVVLKTRVMHGGARQQTWAEVLYLEFLRGKAGVPKLHGAWQEKRSVYYVVQRLSVPLVENSGPSAAWLKTCRARPLEAAVSLIEGVRSFADAGYFDAEHSLDGREFSLGEDGAGVYLIDAPEPLHNSPIRNVVDWALRGTWTDRNATKDGTCVADEDCPRLREHARGERVPGHKRAAREARGWCRNGRCVGVDARAHVYDLATRAWALPLILAEGRFSSQKAKQRLEELIKRMRREAPEDRPSLFVSGVLLSLSKPLVLPRIRSDDFPGSLQDTVGATPRVTQAGGAAGPGRRRRVGARVAHRCHWRRRGGRARRGGGRLVPGRAAAAALDNQFKYRLRPRPRPRRGRPQESFDSCGPPGRPREDARQDVGAQGPERTRDAFRAYVFGAQSRAPGRAPVVRRLARRSGGPRLLRRAARRLPHIRQGSIDTTIE